MTISCFQILSSKKKVELGSAQLAVPVTPFELLDVWLPLVDVKGVAVLSGAAVHVCMQIEPVSHIPPRHKLPLGTDDERVPRTRAKSDFEGMSEAISLNEIIDLLDRVKTSLDLKPDLATLQSCKAQLAQAREQLARLDFDDEYKVKFSDLASGYELLVQELVADATWRSVATRAISSGEVSPPEADGHFISSLDDFDRLLSQGFLCEYRSVMPPGALKARRGDLVRATCTGFIYDGTTMQTVRFTRFDIDLVLGQPPDFVPQGLDRAFEGSWTGCRAVVTVTPEMGFGELGTDEVPPNSHLVYEVAVRGLDPPPDVIVAELDLLEDIPQSPKGEFVEFLPQPALRRRIDNADADEEDDANNDDSPRSEFVDFKRKSKRVIGASAARNADLMEMRQPIDRPRSMELLSSKVRSSLRGSRDFESPKGEFLNLKSASSRLSSDNQALTNLDYFSPKGEVLFPLKVPRPFSLSLTSNPFDHLDEYDDLPPPPLTPPSMSDSPPMSPPVSPPRSPPRSPPIAPPSPPASPLSPPPAVSKDVTSWLAGLGMEVFASKLEEIGIVSMRQLIAADLTVWGEDLAPVVLAQQLLRRDFELL